MCQPCSLNNSRVPLMVITGVTAATGVALGVLGFMSVLPMGVGVGGCALAWVSLCALSLLVYQQVRRGGRPDRTGPIAVQGSLDERTELVRKIIHPANAVESHVWIAEREVAYSYVFWGKDIRNSITAQPPGNYADDHPLNLTPYYHEAVADMPLVRGMRYMSTDGKAMVTYPYEDFTPCILAGDFYKLSERLVGNDLIGFLSELLTEAHLRRVGGELIHALHIRVGDDYYRWDIEERNVTRITANTRFTRQALDIARAYHQALDIARAYHMAKQEFAENPTKNEYICAPDGARQSFFKAVRVEGRVGFTLECIGENNV